MVLKFANTSEPRTFSANDLASSAESNSILTKKWFGLSTLQRECAP